ncbi:hypothetical protein O181_025030 [Austropuccinia psidii MF-1]|uniref:Uncharacterized protein n=1 Tax=Austropuccinia psidii MF-1 TaxID=1389203 RepID=A0A9Q3CLN0_9BASI|nr:hypothetical protein [Austropuccinia psidii MF-1]
MVELPSFSSIGWDFLVIDTPKQEDLILGFDSLNHFNPYIDWKQGLMTFNTDNKEYHDPSSSFSNDFSSAKSPGQMSRQSPAIDFTLHCGQYKILLQSGLGNYTSWCKAAHAYTPAPPSRCDSDNAPPSPPSPLLTHPHPCRLQYSRSCSALNPCYASSSPLLLHLCPHQSLRFCTPATYNPYTPAAPSRYTSYATLNPPYPLLRLPSLFLRSALSTCLQRHPSISAPPILTLLHPCHSCTALKIYL